MSLVWINGRLIDKTDAAVSPFDHGFLYGDGVWEPLRVFNGNLFRPVEHLHNLFRFAAIQGIEVPLTREALTAAIESTIRANHRTEGYIRVIVSRGPGTLGPDPRKIDPQLIIIAEEYCPFPRELYPHGLHAVTFVAPFPDARLLGQPPLVRAKRHALENGCLEAILVNSGGHIIGATEGMLFLVQNGAILVARDRLPEATGESVAALAGELGLVVAEHSLQLDDLLGAREVFLAGTSCGVIGIVRVNEQIIGAGAEGHVTGQLRERFRAVTRGSE